jgi:hypothetical protein
MMDRQLRQRDRGKERRSELRLRPVPVRRAFSAGGPALAKARLFHTLACAKRQAFWAQSYVALKGPSNLISIHVKRS